MGTGITLNVIITRKLLYAIKHTQKYIDEFLEIEEERKRIIEQNKLSIAKWETKMKLDNQNKNKAPDNKE